MGCSRGLAALLLGVLPACTAWWDVGHMMTAAIAKERLLEDLERGERAVEVLDGILGQWSFEFPGASDVVTSAIWPDILKCKDFSPPCYVKHPAAVHAFDSWHFGGPPYNPDKLDLGEHINSMWDEQPSAIWLLDNAMSTFLATESPFAYNFFLRYLIHITGDIHQPLHAVDGYFNDTIFGDLSTGDQGGNKIPVTWSKWPELRNLHSVWDSAGGKYVDEHWPLNSSGQAWMQVEVKRVMDRHPPISFEDEYFPDETKNCAVNNATHPSNCQAVFTRWVDASRMLAIENAWANITEVPFTPSAAYVTRAQAVCERQIVLGGYRLGDLLMEVAMLADAKIQDRRLLLQPTVPPQTPNTSNGNAHLIMALSVVCGVLGVTAMALAMLVYKHKRGSHVLEARLLD